LLAQPIIVTTPTCFDVTAVTASGNCASNMGNACIGYYCAECMDVTISSCNTTELPLSFQIGSPGCFSICTSDFTLGTYSGINCDTTRQQIVWPPALNTPPQGMNGTTDHGTVRICGLAPNQPIYIALIAAQGSPCNTPCTDAEIKLP
jgi:hypothetical protein